MQQFVGILGVLVLMALAVAMSSARRRIDWRLVVGGVALQIAIAVVLLYVPGVRDAFGLFSKGVVRVIVCANEGAAFIFGEQLTAPDGPVGFVFAFRVLPVIVFFASLMGVLYYVGLMQRIIAGLAWVLRTSLRVTGAEALCTAANVFVGQTEAPLCVRPYIPTMTRSQLMVLMVGGFATIAGSVMASFAGMLGHGDEARTAEVVKHLIVASVMSAPAAFVMAKIVIPETEEPRDEGLRAAPPTQDASNLLEAAASGATDGLRLALNVAAMLVAFVAIVALINWPLEAIGQIPAIDRWLASRGVEDLDIKTIFGWILAPLAWCMGVPWGECPAFGRLLGTKIAVTEFIAYTDLNQMTLQDNPPLSPRSVIMATYALCGFANFPSIGIQIGGLAALAPERRADVAALGPRAMLAGALASWQTAALAGIMTPLSFTM
ncbi:MAG: nucleoside transporter C-terminal domain-containing protein [Phycisphaerales bacterium]